MANEAGGDVEECQAQTLGTAAAERTGQEAVADPAGDVVGQRAGVPPQPVPEEVLDGGVDEPEVLLELADCALWDPPRSRCCASTSAAGADTAGALAMHDQAQYLAILLSSTHLDGGLGDLGSLLTFGTERRRPQRGCVGGQL